MAKIKDFYAALDGKLATIDELFMVQEERDELKREKVYILDIYMRTRNYWGEKASRNVRKH